MARLFAHGGVWIALLVLAAVGATIAANLALLSVADDGPVGQLSLRAGTGQGTPDAQPVGPPAGSSAPAPPPRESAPPPGPADGDEHEDGEPDSEGEEHEGRGDDD